MIAPILDRHGKMNYVIQEPDKEWLLHHYIHLDKTMRQIASEIGCSTGPVTKWLGQHKMKKTRESLNKRHSKRMSGAGNPAWLGGTAQNYQKRIAMAKFDRCQWCGTKDDLEMHHIDHNRDNGDATNLTVLCGSCNRIEYWMWKLWKQGQADVTFDTVKRRITIQFSTQ